MLRQSTIYQTNQLIFLETQINASSINNRDSGAFMNTGNWTCLSKKLLLFLAEINWKWKIPHDWSLEEIYVTVITVNYLSFLVHSTKLCPSCVLLHPSLKLFKSCVCSDSH